MSHNVFANNMEISSKASSGKTICNTPDVCFTPPLTPATPPGVPIPYPNTGMASNTADGSTTVKISNQEVMLKNKSNFSKSTGDEAGSAPKKGVVTSKNMGKVYFNAWSMDVKVEGENVPRNLDITTNNHMSKMPGNTPPMPHVSSMATGMGAPKCEPCAAAARAGNPVNPLRGHKLLDGPDDLDFVLEGPLDLVWQRVYMSQLARVGFLGQGWITPVEVHLVIDRSRVTYIDREGRAMFFPSMAVGDTYFHRQEMCTLSRVTPNVYRLVQSDSLAMDFMCSEVSESDSWLAPLASMFDPNNNRIDLQWDEQRKLRRIDGCGDHALLLQWDSDRVTRVIRFRKDDASARLSACVVAEYEYADGDLVAVSTRGQRRTREFAWSNHIMVRHAEPGGLVSSYEWTHHAPDGKVLRSWTNTGAELRFIYGSQRTEVIDQDGHTETFIADNDDHWVGYIDKEGAEHRRVLDADGHLIGIVAPSGTATKTELDEHGLPIRNWDAMGHMSETQWHPTLGLPIAETDSLGRTEQFEYDERGNLLTNTLPDGSKTIYEYDARGLVIALTDALGKRNSFEYDAAGRMTKMLDCTASVESYQYDEHGQLTTIIDPLGLKTRFAYSPAGDVIGVTDPTGATLSFEYDALGRLVRETQPSGRQTRVVLRADGLVTAKTDAADRTTRYIRDAVGRLLAIENPNGAVYKLSYDELGRIVRMKTFEGIEHNYGYSEDGDLAWSEETGLNGAVIKLSYSYDANGNQTRTAASDGEWAEFDYDANDELIVGRNRYAEVVLQHDELGRCISETVRKSQLAATIKNRVREVQIKYDANGNVIGTRIPQVTELGFLHYGSGHLHQILDRGVPYCDIERDAAHTPRSLSHQNVRSTFHIDDGSQIVGIDVDLITNASRDPFTAPLISSRFQYDADGELLSIERDTPTGQESQQFVYDPVGQIVEQTGNQIGQRQFHWDGALNPVAFASERATDNTVRSLGSFTASYDAFGRMVDRSSDNSRIQFEWNAFHQLVGARVHRNGAAVLEQYAYDAFGRRIAKCTNGSETAFLWDGERLAMEEDDEKCRVFVYDDEDQEPIGFIVIPADGDEAQTESESDHLFYYAHNDPNGAPIALTNQDGVVVWRANYDAFGKAVIDDDAQLADHGIQPLRLVGQYFDEATGLCYNRYRYYDPDIGRFISPDPIGLLGGDNFYWYAPNPFSWIDPLGLSQIKKNAKAGAKRHKAAVKQLKADPNEVPPGARISEECPLRSCKTGRVLKDTKKTRGSDGLLKYRKRRLDIVIIQAGKVLKAYEVTSIPAAKKKGPQLAKEKRIRKRGGVCIRNRTSEGGTGKDIKVPMSTVLALP